MRGGKHQSPPSARVKHESTPQLPGTGFGPASRYTPAYCYLCASAHLYQYACDLLVIYRAERGLTDWEAT